MDVLEWGVGWGDGGMEIGIEDCEKTNRSHRPGLYPAGLHVRVSRLGLLR